MVVATGKTLPGPASPWNRFWRDFLEVRAVPRQEVCFGRIPSGNFHAKATSEKSGPPSGNFRQNPPPPTSEKSLQELFQSRGWQEDHLNRDHVLHHIGRGEAGVYTVQAYPNVWKGRVPKCFFPRATLQNKGVAAHIFGGTSPKSLRGKHPYLSTPAPLCGRS